jgi:putative transcriptional regulator
MNKITTTGKRTLKNDVWHDDRGPIPGSPSDWSPPMTDEEVELAALSDPDASPMTHEQLARLRRVPLIKQLRRKLGISQAEFSERYRIPVGTVRDWEQGRAEPDAAALAYLTVIYAHPVMTAEALASPTAAATKR